MSKTTYIRFGAKNRKGVRVSPQTITLVSIVGEPLNFGGTIRLTDAAQIESLLGDDTKYKTEFEDGTTLKWFSDVTAEYAGKPVAKPATKVEEPKEPEDEPEQDEPEQDEPEGEDGPGEDGPGEDGQAVEDTGKTTAKPQPRTTRRK